MRNSIIVNALADADRCLANAEHSDLKSAVEALRTVVGQLTDSDSSDEDCPSSYDYGSDEDYIPFSDDDAHVDAYVEHQAFIKSTARRESWLRNCAIAEKALRKAGKIK